jgi:long-chain fatty acid transport protein
MKDINVGFTYEASGADVALALPFSYRDTDAVSVGAQYQANDRWTLRGGFHYAEQATPHAGVMAVIPSTPTTNLTAGAGYRLGEAGTIDFGLVYAFADKRTNDSLPITSVPIEVRHGQVSAAVAFTRRF